MKTQLYILINSSVGKLGNIGFRAAMVIQELNKKEYSVLVFARYSKVIKNLNFNSYEIFSRALNFIRIYFLQKFDSAKLDNQIFEVIEKYKAQKKVIKGGFEKKIIHLWSPHNKQIVFYKKHDYHVILDVPIATLLHAHEIAKKSDYNFELNLSLVAKEKIAFKECDLIIAPSTFVKSGIIDHYGIDKAKIKLVPFGVDFKKFYSQRNLNNKTDGLTFIFTGALNVRKGLHTLLEAWNNSAFRNDRLILCGRLFPDVKAHIEKLKKVGEIVVPGVVEVSSYLKNSDIYVFPSYLEGSAKSVYEAMASGLPIITTKNAGSIINGKKSGLIVEAGSVDELRKNMIYLKTNPVARYEIGIEAQLEVLKYSWQRYGKKIVEIYNDSKKDE